MEKIKNVNVLEKCWKFFKNAYEIRIDYFQHDPYPPKGNFYHKVLS